MMPARSASSCRVNEGSVLRQLRIVSWVVVWVVIWVVAWVGIWVVEVLSIPTIPTGGRPSGVKDGRGAQVGALRVARGRSPVHERVPMSTALSIM